MRVEMPVEGRVEQYGRNRSVTRAGAIMCVFAVSLAVAVPVRAQGTLEEREACTPDVFRLCSSFIPHAAAITACLNTRKSELSADCRKVIAPMTRLEEAGGGSNSTGRSTR